MARYTPLWEKFKAWASTVQAAVLPADPLIVALYLLMLSQIVGSHSSVKMALAAIGAFHGFASLPSPSEQPIVKAVMAAARRRLAGGVNKKEPLLWEHVQKMAQLFVFNGCPLADLMITTAVAVAFCGFFRYDDLTKIFVDWIVFSESHMEIFLESRKNDQYREGHWVAISAIPNCVSCPVRLTLALIERAQLQGHRPLFSAVCRLGVYKSAAISYSNMRELMLEKFESIGLPRDRFGTHSCRAGGATAAANAGVPDRVWMEHGGWRSHRAAAGYIKTSLQVKLSVNHTMFALQNT